MVESLGRDRSLGRAIRRRIWYVFSDCRRYRSDGSAPNGGRRRRCFLPPLCSPQSWPGFITQPRRRAEADERRREALRATQTSIGRLGRLFERRTLRATGAQKFPDAKVTLTGREPEHCSPETSEIEIGLMLAVSDVKDALGITRLLELAQSAEKLAALRRKIIPPARGSSTCFMPANSGSW